MRITNISVDGFGVWNGLKVEGLSDSLTVFHGANEAGKTTLLQFLRAMLYGASTGRRQQYLPPLHGGKPGGSLRIKTRNGHYTVQREFHVATDVKQGFHSDKITLTRQDGTRDGVDTLKVLLSGVDEAVYQNVYAVGLREIQELGTLSDTDAARLLYDLSAGLDRVSIVEVMRDLKNSREQLLSPEGGPGEIAELLQQRDRVTRQLDEQRQSFARYSQLSGERAALGQEIKQLDKLHAEQERKARITELAFSLRDKWLELSDVHRELAEIGHVAPISKEQLQQFEQLGDQIAIQQRDRRRLKAKRQRLRDQASALPINYQLCKQGPRIEALVEQRGWIASIEREIEKADVEIAATKAKLAVEQKKLGGSADVLSDPAGGRVARVIAKLRTPAREVREAKQRLKKFEQKAAAEVEANAADSQFVNRDLDQALAEANERIEALKRRVELDKKLEKIADQQRDLEQEREELLEDQVLPPWPMIIAGGVFALGVMMILGGLFSGAATGSFGWLLAFLGFFGIFGVIGYKRFMQHRAEEELDECQHEMKALKVRLKEVEDERVVLDADLPAGGGPLAFQLRKAEKDLAALEQRQAADDQSNAANERLSQLRRAVQDAKRGWHRALHELGLPANLSPSQVRDLAATGQKIGELEKHLAEQQADSEQRWNELNACTARIDELFDKSKLTPINENVVDQADQLGRAWNEQQDWLERLGELKTEARQARSEQHELARGVQKLQTRRRAMLRDAGAETAEDYRQLAQAYAKSQVLEQHRERLDSEINTALGGACTHEELAEQLEGTSAEQLERRWDNLAAKLQELDNGRKECLEKRGRISEQLRALSTDRRAVYKQLELNCVEQQLQQAISRWRQLAVTGLLLDSIRRRFELERQPATLHIASQYLETLTGGNYRRVWTPLDEDQLLVDDASGKALSSEQLSRGTREQLFLSLRLSLVTLYSQRGVHLPLVLDDVLVNFDETRARAAADVLRDFAEAGHQLFLFTCHEHLFDIFKSLKVDVRRLPPNGKSGAVLPSPVRSLPKPPPPKPKPKRRPIPMPVAELPKEPELEPKVEEPVAIEPVVEETVVHEEVIHEEPEVAVEEEFEVNDDFDDGETTWEVDADELQSEEEAEYDATDEDESDEAAAHEKSKADRLESAA
jgi:uncharacterized protein YhaN